jgi:hypothetical protein
LVSLVCTGFANPTGCVGKSVKEESEQPGWPENQFRGKRYSQNLCHHAVSDMHWLSCQANGIVTHCKQNIC